MVKMIDIEDCYDNRSERPVDVRSINADLILSMSKVDDGKYTLVDFVDGSKLLTKTSIKTLEARANSDVPG